MHLGRVRQSTELSLIVCRSTIDVRVFTLAWISGYTLVRTCGDFVKRRVGARTFADEAGIHRTYISDIEHGVRNPPVVIVEKLAKPLGVPAAQPIE